MRISAIYDGSNTDVNGEPILDSFDVLDTHSPGRTWGYFATRNERYRGFNELGDNGAVEASWKDAGEYPRQMVASLTVAELTLAYPTDEPGQLIRWLSYPRTVPPSTLFGTSSPGVLINFGGALPISTEWFGSAITGIDRVRIGSGAVWVLTASGLTLLDFTQDRAVRYTTAGAELSDPSLGINPNDIPLGTALAVPGSPYLGMEPSARRNYGLLAVGGSGGFTVLARSFDAAGDMYTPQEIIDLGPDYAVHDFVWLPDGRLVVVGSRLSDMSFFWTVRTTPAVPPLAGTIDDYCTPMVVSSGFEASAPRVALSQDNRVWACFDRGVLRWSEDAQQMDCDTRVDFWSGVRGDSLGIDPRWSSIDPCERLVDMDFSDNIMGILLKNTEAQNGGSLLNVLDPVGRQILYRRRYQSNVRSLTSSPLRRPQSPVVVAGVTNNPPPGFGPD